MEQMEEQYGGQIEKQKGDAIGLEGDVWFQKAESCFLGGDRIALLEKIAALGSITSAAKAVGISYKTAWQLVDMMNNLASRPLVERTTGGKGGGGTIVTNEGRKVIEQFRVVQEEHRHFLQQLEVRLGESQNVCQLLKRIAMRISARNIFAGTVEHLTKGAVNAEVVLRLTGGQRIVSIITNTSADNLGLHEGMSAYAIIKASSILIGQEISPASLSASNILQGTITRVVEGAVNSEVDVAIGGGNSISAIVTQSSLQHLALCEGAQVSAIFKASSVIVGTQ
uniref:Molybdenum-pterin binding protein n=1 Tax=Chlorobium chlorochromatii (strain CaD3) TaxID=340177 RepID=Q3AR84_CHLCH